MTIIAPSILSADFSNLSSEFERLNSTSADWIHVDVMDGHFVPNLTIGPMVIKAIRPKTKLPLDVHLMISNPELYLDEYIRAGASHIYVHVEATNHLSSLLQRLKKANIKAGVAINPATSPYFLEYILDDLDLVLVMSVNPGFGGQKFIESSLDKIGYIKNLLKMHNRDDILINVDGGVNQETASKIIQAGAGALVSGSYIFNNPDYETAIVKLRKI